MDWPTFVSHLLAWVPAGSRFVSLKLIVDGPVLKDLAVWTPPGSPALAPIPAEIRAAAAAEAESAWSGNFSTYLPFGDHWFIHYTIAPDHGSVFQFMSTNQDPEFYWSEKLKREKAFARSEKARATREANKAKGKQP